MLDTAVEVAFVLAHPVFSVPAIAAALVGTLLYRRRQKRIRESLRAPAMGQYI